MLNIITRVFLWYFCKFYKMRKHILIIALLIYTIQGFSQFSVFSEYLPYNQKTDVYTVTSNFDMGLPLIFISGKDVKIFYLSTKYKLQKEIQIKKVSKNSRLYLGSYIIDSNLIISFSNEKLTSISQITVNLNNGSYEEQYTDIVYGNTQFITSLELKDSLYILGIVENTNIFILQKLYGRGFSSIQQFNFDSVFFDKESPSISSIINKPGKAIRKIDSSIPVSLKISSCKNKIYMADNKITITLDEQNNTTQIYSLNLEDNTCSIDTILYKTLQNTEDSPALSNSFIYDNTIFQISVNKYEFGLNIKYLGNTDTATYFHFSRGNNIDFSNSAMYERNEKEGFLFGDPVTWEIKTTRKFLKMMSNMDPAISVFSKYPNFQILLGGIMDVHQAAGIMSNTVVSSGGEMIVGPNGSLIMPDPKYNFPTNYSFTSYSSNIIAYFSSMINTTSLTHSNKSISKYTYDYIIEYVNYMSGRHGLVTIFKMNGDYYLGYYSYGDKTYNIEWFKNIDDYSVQY